MKLNISLSIKPTVAGIPVANATGFLNIYKTTDGAIISGGKLYPSADVARRKSRGKANWTLLGQISVSDYVHDLQPMIQNAAHKAAIATCDARLKSLLGITDPAPVCFDSGNAPHPIDTTPEPTTAVVAKPKAIVKKKSVKKTPIKKKAPVKKKAAAKKPAKPISKAKVAKKSPTKTKTPAKKKIASKKK